MNSEKSRTATTSHTPGPWGVAHVGKSLEGNYGAGFAVPCVIATNGATVAELMRSDSAMANARLIAAAPDLLAALRVIIDNEHRRLTGGSANEPTLRDIINALDAGRAAITKATGAAS